MRKDQVICILHGYLLEGSGSNLWTRAVVHALCRQGHPVHLVCQETHPERYDFVAAAYVHERDGSVGTLFERDTPYPGACVLHKPRLGDTLPVYVRDRYEEFADAVPMIELPDAAIEDYLSWNAAIVERVVRDHGVTAIHANHAVLMSVVAERVAAATGIPFAVMPHGSAIEYVVKRDRRFHALATGAFDRAGCIFVLGPEMRGRVAEVFPDRPGLARKFKQLDLGVDTKAFEPVGPKDRKTRIAALSAALRGLDRGRRPAARRRLRGRLEDTMQYEDLSSALAEARDTATRLPDAGLEKQLEGVDWAHDRLLLFVGRLIASKGLQSIVAALPRILDANPRARLVVVGHGPLREVMEALLWALEHGKRELIGDIVDWGSSLEGGKAAPFEEVRGYLAALATRRELDDYFRVAQAVIRPERVIFTGYLTHAELKHLMPCCDVAIFPSVVAEAGPLVFLEALAAGCFPLGTDFAGMAASIDAVAGRLPPGDADLMRLSNDRTQTVEDIVSNTIGALALAGRHKETLRDAVAARHDWDTVAGTFADELVRLAG